MWKRERKGEGKAGSSIPAVPDKENEVSLRN